MKIKKFNESARTSASCRTIGELKKFIDSLPDEMEIVACSNGGGSSPYTFFANTEDFDHPDQKVFMINVD